MLSGLSEKLFKGKNKIILYVILIIGVLMLCFGSFEGKKDEVKKEKSTITKEIQRELENTLTKMSGVGRVSVALSYETGTEIVPAQDKDNDSETVVNIGSGSGEETVVIKEIMPKIRGVIVVAEGGGNTTVRENIKNAVSALTGAQIHNIAVFAMK